MRIEHVAIWTGDLKTLKNFYTKYFNCTAENKYHNASNDFESYFLSFDNGTRLELMQMPSIPNNLNNPKVQYGELFTLLYRLAAKKMWLK